MRITPSPTKFEKSPHLILNFFYGIGRDQTEPEDDAASAELGTFLSARLLP